VGRWTRGVGGFVAELVMGCGLNTKFGLYKFGKYHGNFSFVYTGSANLIKNTLFLISVMFLFLFLFPFPVFPAKTEYYRYIRYTTSVGTEFFHSPFHP